MKKVALNVFPLLSLAENKIDSNTGTLTVRQFSAPHMGSCSCVMCMSVKRDIEKEESAESNNISKCVPLNAVREEEIDWWVQAVKCSTFRGV